MQTVTINELKNRWVKFKQENPKMRIRDAAKNLGVSEMELLCASDSMSVVQLQERFDELLLELVKLGRVMALTRNESVVHERKGVYNKAEVMKGHAKMALVLDEEIDLRIFFSHWKYGFAVTEQIDDGERNSLHFFDKSGAAIHKIYLTEKSNKNAFFDLLNAFRKEEPDQQFALEAMEDGCFRLNDSEIDVKAFQQSWDEMTDTHQFFGMLKKHKVDRMQALRLAGKERAYQVSKSEMQNMLEFAAEQRMEIMVFVSNAGMVQIHTGTVTNIKVMDNWVNVLDPDFNLHIKGHEIAYVWVVKKPAEAGQVTALECYDKHENMVVQYFGKRKPGIPESLVWRGYVEALEAIDA